MKKLLFTLSALFLLFVGCSNSDNDLLTNESEAVTKNNPVIVKPDSLYYGDFIGNFQTSELGNPGIFMQGTFLQILSGDYEHELKLSDNGLSLSWSDGNMRLENGKIISNEVSLCTDESISFNTPVIKINGNVGRTAKREITDKEGNIHTFVFENGLFVDELLNGVSVFNQ